MISILLATYNGEKFLDKQLASLFKQTCQDFTIIVSDDGSADGTLKILAAYQQKYPGRLVLLPPRHKTAGSTKAALENFAYLLKNCPPSDYIFMCDQDDIWLPHKIELSLQKMKLLENMFGHDAPLLVHGAFTLCDAVDQPFTTAQSADIERRRKENYTLNHMLVECVTTGCTECLNAALLQYVRNIPAAAIMHDYWIGLVAAAIGHIGYIEEPLMLYRQHDGNTIGVHSGAPLHVYLSPFNMMRRQTLLRNQARALLQLVQNDLLPENEEIIRAFINLDQVGHIQRIKNIKKYSFWYDGNPTWKNYKLVLLPRITYKDNP